MKMLMWAIPNVHAGHRFPTPALRPALAQFEQVLCLAITYQSMELESYSNPLKIQSLLVLIKKTTVKFWI